MKKLMIAGMIAVLSTGCATQTYLLSNGGQNVPTKETWQHFFVSGIGQTQTVNAAEICGGADKVAKIQTEYSLLNGVAGMVSQGLYTPRQNRVFCK